MTTRATDADVRSMVQMPAGAPTNLYLEMANMLVNESLVPLGTLSAERLTAIERFLAAHFATVVEERGGLAATAITRETQDTYMRNNAMGGGISSTRFGLQAVALDTTGTLDAMCAKPGNKTAQIRVVGGRRYGTC